MIYIHGFESMPNTCKVLRINNSSMICIHGFESMLNTVKSLNQLVVVKSNNSHITDYNSITIYIPSNAFHIIDKLYIYIMDNLFNALNM